MRKLAVLTFLTLDGVMQAPVLQDEDLSGGFTRGGWSVRFVDEVMAQVNAEGMIAPIDFLFGRRTYDMFASYWPTVGDDNPHARFLNNATKFVATSNTSGLEWQNTKPITGNTASEVARL